MKTERVLISGTKSLRVLCLAGLFALTTALNFQLVNSKPEVTGVEHRVAFPSELLLITTIGYQHLYAQLLWIKAVAYFGAHLNQSNFPYLASQLQSIAMLNPKAEHAYYMAATVIPWSTNSTLLSKPVLQFAIRHNPQDWRWPYYRGFNAYWFDHDYETAKRFLSKASTLPNVHPTIINIALRIQSETGQIDTALAFLKQLIVEKQDKNIRKNLLLQYKMLLTEKALRAIDTWLEQHSMNAYNISSLEKLISMGAPIPKLLPDGGIVILNADGEIVSSTTGKRFKIFVPPKIRTKSR